jgi:amino acid permease
MFLCLVNREVTPDLGESFNIAINNFDITVLGVFNSIPLVIFSYMYQTNIPMIYSELHHKNLKSMKTVMVMGTIGATISYMIAGIFGYAAFANYPTGYASNYNEEKTLDGLMNLQNILKCYPNNPVNLISLFGILTVVIFATPVTILPCKDTIEELYLKPDPITMIRPKLSNK